MSTSQATPSASIEARSDTPDGTCVLTYSALDTQDIIQSVADDGAGATAVFIGTTRNSFKGSVVTQLEYQAYSRLAIKTMADIVHNAHQAYTRSEHQTPSVDGQMHAVIRTALYHRLGTVPVGEPSIVIAVSSPHRKEAFMACEQILEDVKRRAQIWKREFYEGQPDEEAEWKANSGH
ncbi:molybdenum cofactor synthesis 2 [Epithele typhae]|uniref:molybdenum cofactor synthesis 2 n=1 Tax=Epithele typhae TaxID=378194 RepID=UPI0020076748|nr:molybdenum cofactor synthesis 2 [Epithele typhae]KAH9944316.1 molybdenum cofactor synthesis 2 [Epithele typhae]